MINTRQVMAIAWKFLIRNSEYKADWQSRPAPKISGTALSYFQLYQQSPFDRSAEKWGLFAYADPTIAPELAPVFWSITPILDAVMIPECNLPLLPMIRETGARISGLLLLEGDLILKVDRGGDTVQIRIKDGRSFDETCGLMLCFSLGPKLPVMLSRSLCLWNIVAGEKLKKIEVIEKLIMTNFFLFLTAYSPTKPIAI